MLAKYEKRLAAQQRKLSRKNKDSRNYNKQRKRVAQCYEKIANTRKNYLHKISHEIVSESRMIAAESLPIAEMVKDHHVAKSLLDVSWGEFIRLIEYKAEWNGRQYVKANSADADRQLCSVCGHLRRDAEVLPDQKWTCPACGTEHDRDTNAARNLLAEGLRQLTK